MPSSGARSGTPPSRDRSAGDGSADPGPPMLKCGHQADSEPVIVFPANKKRYWCDLCRTLVAAK